MTDTNKRMLTTYVETELYDEVQAEARRKQVSVAAVVRWAVSDYFSHITVSSIIDGALSSEEQA